MRVSRYHYYCFIYHRSEEVTVSDVIWAGGGNKRQLRPQSTAGLLSIHQSQSQIPELREGCPSPTHSHWCWGLGRSETTCQEAGS